MVIFYSIRNLTTFHQSTKFKKQKYSINSPILILYYIILYYIILTKTQQTIEQLCVI